MESTIYNSPYGELKITTENEFIVSLSAVQANTYHKPESNKNHLQRECIKQLESYFKGSLTAFDLPYKLAGTPFQQLVWRMLEQIPFGHVSSYSELAKQLGNANYTRAVGGACGKNPLLIIVPCHRVIGKNGKLTGFAAGLQWKSRLLEIEEVITSSHLVDLDGQDLHR